MNNVSSASAPKYLKLITVLCLACLVGCATAGSVPESKLRDLAPGMGYEEIISALGKPYSSSVAEDNWELIYYFHDVLYQSSMPYKLVLNKATRRLESWAVDQERYERDQRTAARLLGNLGRSQPAAPASAGSAPPGQAAPAAGGLSGSYWGFAGGGTGAGSGGTQVRVMLCPNGSFRIATESSYSGTEGGSNPSMWYGTTGGSNWQGTWNVQGSNLIFYYSNGSQEPVRYDAHERCIFFRNGSTACYQGPAKCR